MNSSRILLTLCFCCSPFCSELPAEKLGPPPKYADQDYDPLPANYAEIAKQYVASRFKDSHVYVRLVVAPLHTAYPVEINGKTDYRPCWNLLLKAQSDNGEYIFIVFFYKDRVVGTMTTRP